MIVKMKGNVVCKYCLWIDEKEFDVLRNFLWIVRYWKGMIDVIIVMEIEVLFVMN